MLKMSNARIKVGWMEGENELSVSCIKAASCFHQMGPMVAWRYGDSLVAMRVRSNTPAARYWLRPVPYDGGRQD